MAPQQQPRSRRKEAEPAMEHVAIDLGGRESQVCRRRAEGAILEERRMRTRQLRGWLREIPRSRVVVETCAEAFKVADWAVEAGHEIRVVPATLVRSLGVGARQVKTDQRDAQVLSEVSCRIDLPTVHVPSSEARMRKSLSGMREGLVSARTQLINTVRGWLRTQSRQVRSGSTATFAQRVRRMFEAESANALPRFVERQLEAIEQLTVQVREADTELSEMAERDPVCRRSMTLDGVGPVTAVRFAAAIDEVSRFRDAHAVASYLGLTPGEDSSSDRRRRTGITKAGAPALRRTLLQAAWAARRSRRRGPLQAWADEVEKRRGPNVATTALARKMAGILYAMWRDGRDYEPHRAARPSVQPTPPESPVP